jgi:hypothetical protein
MQTGTIVTYKQHPEDNYDPGFPAIVMREWPDGGLQLYVLQFDTATNIRAAHPTQVTVMVDPERLEEGLAWIGALRQTATAQEKRLTALENKVTPRVESTPAFPDLPPLKVFASEAEMAAAETVPPAKRKYPRPNAAD